MTADALGEFLDRVGSVTVLTGAGVSTASGIPDYRGPETARRARNPVQYRQFLDDPEDDTPPRGPHTLEEIEAWEKALSGG